MKRFKAVTIRRQLQFLPLVVLTILVGCIPIQDFGKAWDQSTIDPELEGHWKQLGQKIRAKDHYESFIRKGDAYDMEEVSAEIPELPKELAATIPPQRARTLAIGKHKFLLIRMRERIDAFNKINAETDAKMAKAQAAPPKDKQTPPRPEPEKSSVDGGIQRYTIEKGVLTYYFLKDSIIDEALKKGEVKGKIVPRKSLFSEPSSLAALDGPTLKFIEKLADDEKNWDRDVQFTRVKDIQESLKESRTYPATSTTGAATTVHVDLPAFKFFMDGKSELFRRQLQASPDWFVFQERGEIVVYHRTGKGGVRPDMPGAGNGYESNHGLGGDSWHPVPKSEQFQIRYLFRFDPRGGEQSSSAGVLGFSRSYKRAEPQCGDTRLNIYNNGQGIQSLLAIGAHGFWFEFFEEAQKEDRIKTREALAWLDGFSRELQAAATEIEENGYAAKPMPAGAIAHGKPTMTFKNPYEDGDPRALNVYAAVNPGRQGFVMLRAFNAVTNAPLDEEISMWHGKQYLGWSRHPETLFPYRVELNLPESITRKGNKVRFELWFRPTDGSASRKWSDKTAPEDVKLVEAVKDF